MVPHKASQWQRGDHGTLLHQAVQAVLGQYMYSGKRVMLNAPITVPILNLCDRLITGNMIQFNYQRVNHNQT